MNLRADKLTGTVVRSGTSFFVRLTSKVGFTRFEMAIGLCGQTGFLFRVQFASASAFYLSWQGSFSPYKVPFAQALCGSDFENRTRNRSPDFKSSQVRFSKTGGSDFFIPPVFKNGPGRSSWGPIFIMADEVWLVGGQRQYGGAANCYGSKQGVYAT